MKEHETPRIRLDEVKRSFPVHGGEKIVLNNINLHIRPGELTTLVGPSGCGKTTLLKLVLGSDRPTAGGVMVDGELVHNVNRDRGVVFQRYGLFPHVSVWENIALGPILEGTTLTQRMFFTPGYRKIRRDAKKAALELIDRIGLCSADADKYPFELSGGMCQRVAIAQALMMKPKVILMDEPFGALDPKTREGMQLLLLEQWKETGATIIFVTHDLEEAVFLGSRLIAVSQYWSGENGEPAQGARIVYDIASPWDFPRPASFKYEPAFNEIQSGIRAEAFDPQHLQRTTEFTLTHPDVVKPGSPGGVI